MKNSLRALVVFALISAIHFLTIQVENERLILEERIERERAIQSAFDETSYQGNRDSKARRFFPGYAEADRVLGIEIFAGGSWQVEANLDHAAHYRKQMGILQHDRTIARRKS